ncbi:MAG: glycosyltransferase family 9 protein [Magnetococcales bacterium]|nr:glycosyltransferase family 9 protein [Magnetococcales bacterium]
MHPDRMRLIDRWLGSLLCLLASLMRWIWSRLVPATSASPRELKRILFIGIAETGALVLAHPALQWTRQRYPNAEIAFLSFRAGRGVLNLLGFDPVSQQILLRSAPWYLFVWDTLKTILRLRHRRFDATVNLEVYTRFSTLLAFLSGAPVRVGFYRFFEEGHYLGELITHRVIYNPHQAIGYSYLSLAKALAEPPGRDPLVKIPLGVGEPLERLQVRCSDANKKRMWATIERLYPSLTPQHHLVILNANASDLIPARRWPSDRFILLGQRLLAERPKTVILLTGSPAERAALERLRLHMADPRVINMAGETTLETLIDLYAISHLMVTNDSGPVHFSSITDIPLLALFGPETPRLFGPVSPYARVIYRSLACSPCVSVYNQKRSPCTDNRCMQEISVDDVFAHVCSVLDAGAVPTDGGFTDAKEKMVPYTGQTGEDRLEPLPIPGSPA